MRGHRRATEQPWILSYSRRNSAPLSSAFMGVLPICGGWDPVVGASPPTSPGEGRSRSGPCRRQLPSDRRRQNHPVPRRGRDCPDRVRAEGLVVRTQVTAVPQRSALAAAELPSGLTVRPAGWDSSMRLSCPLLERNVIKVLGLGEPSAGASFLDGLDESDRADHVPEDQETLVVVQHLVIVCEALLVSHSIERFHN